MLLIDLYWSADLMRHGIDSWSAHGDVAEAVAIALFGVLQMAGATTKCNRGIASKTLRKYVGQRKSHASTWNPWPADDFITCFRRKDHEPRFPWQNVMLFCLGSSYLPGGVPIPWLKIESPQPLRMRAEIQKLSAYRKGLSRSNRIFTLCGTLAEVPEYLIHLSWY